MISKFFMSLAYNIITSFLSSAYLVLCVIVTNVSLQKYLTISFGKALGVIALGHTVWAMGLALLTTVYDTFFGSNHFRILFRTQAYLAAKDKNLCYSRLSTLSERVIKPAASSPVMIYIFAAYIFKFSEAEIANLWILFNAVWIGSTASDLFGKPALTAWERSDSFMENQNKLKTGLFRMFTPFGRSDLQLDQITETLSSPIYSPGALVTYHHPHSAHPPALLLSP
ncbi:MAG: hypothetical protein KBD64_00140 [Gammaproteobacteria bacterium]|nr:hypothetical protein [Gammaproteobacteria bacterium]